MSIIIYLFEFTLPMCYLNPEFLKRDCGTIPVAEITSGKIEIETPKISHSNGEL
jgi:hypothetical protein